MFMLKQTHYREKNGSLSLPGSGALWELQLPTVSLKQAQGDTVLQSHMCSIRLETLAHPCTSHITHSCHRAANFKMYLQTDRKRSVLGIPVLETLVCLYPLLLCFFYVVREPNKVERRIRQFLQTTIFETIP